MTLLEWFDRLETTGIGTAVRESVWLFPVIESIHLVALASLAGAVLVVDLRLLGVGIRRPARELLAHCFAVVRVQSRRDVRDGDSALSLGGREVLLPPGVLGENVRAHARHRVHVCDP